jgi:sugar/nucleoside kinase (ribokinase family)
MVESGIVDILFGNEDELLHLTGRTDLDSACADLSRSVSTLVATRGAAGAIAVTGEHRIERPAAPVERVVDTTGAGDLFASGFLAGITRGRGVEDCLKMGAIAAAEVISHYGARPEADLKALVAQKLG